MKQHLGIIASCLPHSEAENIAKIKEAGFDTVFLSSFEKKTVCEIKNECEKHGITAETIHAPFYTIEDGRWISTNEFWMDGCDYFHLFRQILETIDSAAEAGIPVVVSHVSGGWVAPPLSDIGFYHFDRLVEYAWQKGVKIAFENIRNVGNVAALMERYERIPAVGYCFDCGHEHCYTETAHFLDFFHDRLLCTHIHDNFGRSKEDPMKDTDIHLLPFDGNIDYADMMSRYKKYGCTVPLTLEVGKGAKYKDLSEEEFLATAFERIKKISKM